MSTMSAARERHTSYLGVENAPTLFVSALQKPTLFVNRERCDEPNHGMTPP